MNVSHFFCFSLTAIFFVGIRPRLGCGGAICFQGLWKWRIQSIVTSGIVIHCRCWQALRETQAASARVRVTQTGIFAHFTKEIYWYMVFLLAFFNNTHWSLYKQDIPVMLWHLDVSKFLSTDDSASGFCLIFCISFGPMERLTLPHVLPSSVHSSLLAMMTLVKMPLVPWSVIYGPTRAHESMSLFTSWCSGFFFVVQKDCSTS